MKNSINILMSSAILFFINIIALFAQNNNVQYLGPDSDTIRPGNIYLVELKNNSEYLGKVVKIDSFYILFKNSENELKKIRKTGIKKCLNVFTNQSFNEISNYYWIINLNSQYYDSVGVKGSWVEKDSIRLRMLNNKYIKVPFNKITGVEIYINHPQDLESDPMNMFFPYMILSSSGVNTDEFSFAGLSNKWKAAQFRYLIYKY